MPAPDIFSGSSAAGVGSMLSGMNLASHSTGTADFGSSSNTNDLFGGLALSGAAATGAGGQQQQQQQRQVAMSLAPPPSASTQINAGSRGTLMVGSSSSSNADPFAGLLGGSSSSSMGAAPHRAAGSDPFSSLAAAPSSSTGDPFASLAGGGSHSAGVHLGGAQRPAAGQQQQQWDADLLL
jgi:hypothetical protein